MTSTTSTQAAATDTGATSDLDELVAPRSGPAPHIVLEADYLDNEDGIFRGSKVIATPNE